MTEICATKKPDCQNEATIRSFWPGEYCDLICAECALARKRIADAMGFQFHQESFIPLLEEEDGAEKT